MAGKTDTRVSRSFTFSFDEDADKERFHQLAKAEGRSLSSLIKRLLAQHAQQQGPATPAAPVAPGAGVAG